MIDIFRKKMGSFCSFLIFLAKKINLNHPPQKIKKSKKLLRFYLNHIFTMQDTLLVLKDAKRRGNQVELAAESHSKSHTLPQLEQPPLRRPIFIIGLI